MNPTAILALIAELYEKLAAEGARADRAENALRAATEDAESGHEQNPQPGAAA